MIPTPKSTAPLTLALALCASGCSDDTSPAGGAIDVQISGEDAATDGFLFPDGSEVVFADGWELRFSHVLVTVGNVTVAENPNLSPSDQSQTGAAVARAAGPWAVDLTIPGTALGAGGEGKATPLTTIANQNLRDGAPFEADAQYAFGYDLIAASDAATVVNFAGDGEAEAAYARMVERGYAVLYAGTATFRGGDDCATSDASYDFDAIPAEIPFELGFATPSSYLNCQNEENDGDAFPDEEFPRGIAILPNRAALAQITLHLEHPWFSSIVHDSNLYFDPMAARLTGAPAGTTLTIDDLAGADPTALTDATGAALPARECTGEAPDPGQRSLDVGTIPVDPNGDPGEVLRDYRDYVNYVQSTQAHLNGGEGICFVRRNYPSPP
jgi:hypothetical protein